MVGFRVTLNGVVLATAGIEGEHVLSAIVNSTAGKRQFEEPHLWMHLGGLVSGYRAEDASMWIGYLMVDERSPWETKFGLRLWRSKPPTDPYLKNEMNRGPKAVHPGVEPAGRLARGVMPRRQPN